MKDFNKYFIVGTNSDALHDTMNGTVIGELIRCKDCKNYYPNMEADGETGDCKKARWFRRLQYPNDYCSRAERKPPQVNPEMVREMKERLEKYKND